MARITDDRGTKKILNGGHQRDGLMI